MNRVGAINKSQCERIVAKIQYIISILLYSLLSQLHAADVILTNGKIYTVNETQPWAQAMVIFDGVIEYVGSNEAGE